MSRIGFLGLFALAFVIPWELFVEFPGFGALGRLVGVAAFALGMLAVIVRGRVRAPGAFLVLTLGYVLWVGLSLFWSVDPESTEKQFKTHMQLLVLMWLIWELADTLERQRWLLQAYVFGAYVSALSTVQNFLSGTQVATGRFAADGFNPNDLGFTLALAVPMAWYLATAVASGVLTWVNRLYIPVGLAGILLTASRGALVPAVVALGIIPLTFGSQRLRAKILIFCLGLMSLGFLATFVPASSWARLSTTTEQIEGGDFSYRGHIWRAGWEVFLAHPAVGVGAGGFSVAVAPILGSARPPHQTYLSVMVGTGLVGLTIFASLFAAAFFPTRGMPSLERRLRLVLVATLLIGLIPRTWDYRKPLWLIFGVVAARGAAIYAPRISSRRGSSRASAEGDWRTDLVEVTG